MISALGLALLLCAPAPSPSASSGSPRRDPNMRGAAGARAGETATDPGAGAAQAYALDTSGSTSSLGVGETGKLVLVIKPRGPDWHVHPQAPLKVRFEAPPGLKFEKLDLRRRDAVDPRAEEPRFEAPFVALAAGTESAKADVDFFVCSATACVRQLRVVTFPVSVKSVGRR
jgi:hypothetical protein